MGETYDTFTWRPRKKTLERLELAKRALEEFRPRTVRSIFYYLVAAGLIENTVSEYRSVTKMLLNARKARLISWWDIVDNVRGLFEFRYWSDLVSFKKAVPDYFHLDPTPGQSVYCELWLEKDALAPIVEPVCDEYRVPLHICRGFDSWTMSAEAVPRFRERSRKYKREAVVLHLADFDPAGWYMTADLENRFDFFQAPVWVSRVALTPVQADSLTKNPKQPKWSNTRDQLGLKFLELFGPIAVELDALPVADLQALIREAIEERLDVAELKVVLAQESEKRSELERELGLE